MSEFTTSDGLRLYYDDVGSGLPLLCLAGLTRNTLDFDPIVARYGATHRIIRVDMRGRGQSAYDPIWQNYNFLRESADVVELLDHLKLDQVAILGTSRGGLIAMMLAPMHGHRMCGVMLNDVGPVTESDGIERIVAALGVPPAFADYDAAAAHLATTMVPAFEGISLAEWRVHAERIWAKTPDGLANRYDPALRDAIMAAVASGAAPDLWPLYDAITTMPHGLIRGANSSVLSAETATEMCRRGKSTIFAEVPGRGHVPFLDEPEAVAAMDQWLEAMV